MPDEFGKLLEEEPVTRTRAPHSSDYPPGIFEQRHLKSPAKIVYFGLAANRPDGSSSVKAWFATDTGALSMWDGSSWLSTTLS